MSGPLHVPTGTSRDVTTPALREVTLKYHALPADRLERLTRLDLVSAGVPEHALGGVVDGVFTLSPCIELSAAARASLPPVLGGASLTFAASPSTASVVAQAYPRSPSGAAAPALARSLFPDDARGRSPERPARPVLSSSPSSGERRAALVAAALALEGAEEAEHAAAAASAVASEARADLRRATTARRGRSASRTTGPTLAPVAEASPGAVTAEASPLAPATEPPAASASAGGAGGAGAAGAGGDPVGSASSSASALAPDASDLTDALAAVALAEASERESRHAARRARDSANSCEAALSPLSADGRGSGYGPAPGTDPAREQQHIVALNASLGHMSDAIGYLTGHARRYPLTIAALRAAGGNPESSTAVLQDFSVLVLLPAVHAAKQQEHGMLLLAKAAEKDQSTPDSVRAAQVLRPGGLYDVECASAIRTGRVRVTVSPLDLCLGVVPIAQLSLFLFLGHHAFRLPTESPLIEAARKVSFVANGRLHPAGVDSLYAAWGVALGEGQDIPHAQIMFHLVEILARDADAPGALRARATIGGRLTSWTDFALNEHQKWQESHSGRTSARRETTLADLRDLFDDLSSFTRAGLTTAYSPGSTYPPSAGYTNRCLSTGGDTPGPASRPPPSSPATVPAPPTPTPPRAPKPVKARLAAAQPALTRPVPGPVAASLPFGAAPGDPAFLRIPFLVVPGSQSILSTSPLVAAGWVITLSSDSLDSHYTIPGVKRRHPLWRDAAGNYYATFVVANGGMAVANASLPAHAHLIRHHFLLDSGAEVSIVGPGGLSLLRELGSRPIPVLRAVAGPALPVLNTGILLLILPSGALQHPPAPWEAGGGHPTGAPAAPVLYTSGTGPGWSHLRDVAASTHCSDPHGPPVPAGAAAAVPDAVQVAATRTSAFPPIKDVMTIASRFNLNTAAAILSFLGATALGLAPGLAAKVDADTDYSQGYASAAILKAPPIHAARYEISMAIRDATPPGSVWWTDISNVRPADFDGNVVSRLFAEERTGYAITYYSQRKDSATLVEQLRELALWVSTHVPGGELRVLRCDFASEAVKQGHGDDIYTAGIREYSEANPTFRLMPVAPHSPALNRAEGTWGRIIGGTMLNARRARIGPSGWSLMERGAVFQHNHCPAPHALDPASHACSRSEALTLRVFDASTMLGYPGQTGWTHRPDGKANALRTTADPVLYLCPATSMHAQLVFNLRSFKITVVRSVALSVDPFGCALVLAGSALHRPSGSAFEPTPDAYEARLNALLLWGPVSVRDHAVVSHDPVLGLPLAVCELTPHYTEDGTIVMLTADEAAPSPDAPAAAPPPPGPVLPVPPAAVGTPPAAGWVPTWAAGPRLHVAANDVNLLKQRMLDAYAAPGGPPWPLFFDPEHSKARGSRGRWDAYRGASTFREFRDLHAAYRLAHPSDHITWGSDLSHDLARGIAQAAPPSAGVSHPPPAIARRTVSWHPALDPGLGRGRAPAPLPAATSPTPAVTRVPTPSASAAPPPPGRGGRQSGPDDPITRMLAEAKLGHPPWALRFLPPPRGWRRNPRWDAYCTATSFPEFRALHAAYSARSPHLRDASRWGTDLRSDLAAGRATLTPPSPPDTPPGPHPWSAWGPLGTELPTPPSPPVAPPDPHPWSAWEPLGSEQGTDPHCRRMHVSVLQASLDILSDEYPALALGAESAHVRALDGLEPSPLPGRSPGDGAHPDTTGDPRVYTSAYAAGHRVLRVSLAEDYDDGPPPLDDASDDEDAEDGADGDLASLSPPVASWGGTGAGPIPPPLAFLAAPVVGAPVAPTSVAAARRLPDFDAPHGWRQAIHKEITRVEGFRAWELASAGDVRAARARYGDHRVSIGYIVAVLTCKLDPAGEAREAPVVNKFRVAVADKADAASGVLTHSNCVDDITNRLITAIAPAIGAEQDSIDIGGAYFHGVPPDMDHGGRMLYVRIPAWLAALYPSRYPLRGARGTNFLLITGNMPGRCDAGRIWQARLDSFLRRYGMSQAETDRRVWTLHTVAGSLIVHDHVDDSRITATTTAARLAFHHAWAAEFKETITTRALSEDFTGLRHTRIDALTTAVSCEGVIRRLGVLLADLPPLKNEKCDWPLPMTALRTLAEGPSTGNPLSPHLTDVAAPILGTIGFVAGMARPDAYFAFCVLSRYAGVAKITEYAFRRVVCLGHYLVRSIGMHLQLSTPPLIRTPGRATNLDLLACYVDSSNGNAEHGASYGGFVLASCGRPPADPTRARAQIGPRAAEHHGGGVIAWRCSAPPQGDDSSGASELRMATLAYKYLLAALLLLAELRVGVTPSGPTPFYLDAQAVLDGTTCERLAKKSRWMAMRYAMLRWGIACGTIDPRKLPSARNPSDGLTKCLVGKAFANARARLLGHPLPHPAD